MKIGLVRRGFSGTGGAEAYLLRLAHGLVRAGEEPILITSEAWPEDGWPGGKIIRLPGASSTKFARAFASQSFDVDLTFSLERVPGCDVYRAGDGVHAAWLQRRARFEPGWKSWFHRYNPKHLALMHLERQVFRSARAVIANSRMVAEEIRHWHDYPEEQVSIVPNGIGTALPRMDRAVARAKLGLREDVFCGLFVGTGWERKGLKFGTAAFESLDEDALLLVAGRGPVARYASPRAKFVGPMKDLSALFSAADVFVLPTIYDPFSNACLEALAAGLPVITTTANGFSEIIAPGVHGHAVEPGDVAALTRALKFWRISRANTEEACRLLAASYTIERNVNETLAVLNQVAAGKR
jgi:UDP-glucose:(heptosyl)LPS alpha-1,3-glucosyltransferase